MPPAASSARRTWWAVGACTAVAAIGLGLFALAFRDCRLEVPEGRSLGWELIIRTTPVSADGGDGPERQSRHRISLVGLGPDPDSAAWVSGPADGPPARVHLVEAARDGRLRMRLADGRPGESGPMEAGFDLNLLPLPLGAEPEWKAEVVWAALPPGKRTVACTVKRLRSGASPQFRCDFPTSVEWVDPATGRYRQVRNLSATYRFDTLRHAVREARVAFTLREELPPPGGFAARRVVFELAWTGSQHAGEAARLRDDARLASLASALAAARRPLPADLIGRLQRAEGPFSGIVDGLRGWR